MRTSVLMAIALIIVSLNCKAQEKTSRLGFELNSGVSVATNKLNGTDLNTGFGFEGIFNFRILPHAGVYAGWGWNRLGADNSFAGSDVCFEETGYVFGLEFKHPFFNSPLSYYLRAGGLYNHIETENSDGDIINDSGHGLGYQLAGGINLPLSTKWSLTPGIKYNSLSRDTDFEGETIQLNHNYLSFRIGINKKF